MASDSDDLTRVTNDPRSLDATRLTALNSIRTDFASFAEGRSPEERMELELRTIRPGLVVERSVGEGGMASVHAALDHGLSRRVAVKIMHTALERVERTEARFVEEAQLTGQMEHPNIVPIHEIGTTREGTLYFAMKLVGGRSLGNILRARPPAELTARELDEIVKVLVKVCDALSFAHARGVVHRDLKPDNVQVGQFGEVHVMDWGIALRVPPPGGSTDLDDPFPVPKPLDTLGTIIGTPEYMAPEQAFGNIHDIDARTDVFGVGAMLYRVLTGRAPFHDVDEEASIEAAQRGEVVPPQAATSEVRLPPMLCAIAMRALAPKREDRHQTIADLQQDLERFLRGSAWFPEQSFEAGAWIVREGEEADSAYVINSGVCEAGREEAAGWMVLRRMEAGQVFGETAIFANSRRSASVRAVTAVRTTVVSRDALLGELNAGSWMTPFVRTLAERFADQSREVSTLRDRVTLAEVSTRAVLVLARSGAGLESNLGEVVAQVQAATGLTEGTVRDLLREAPGLTIEGDRIRARS